LSCNEDFHWRALALIFLVAIVVNYVWELAQAPLYVGLERYSAAVFWHCLVASFGDGLMVLLIVTVGWIILQKENWFECPRIPGYLVMIITGLIVAVSVEWVAVHILERWQYTQMMPTVLGIGVVPVAQMLVLPPVIFWIVSVQSTHKKRQQAMP
jgi:hypothetical protein